MTIPRLTGPLSNWIANAAPGERIIAQTHIHGQNDEVREENERLREIIATQAETIRRYQQDARTRIARSGE